MHFDKEDRSPHHTPGEEAVYLYTVADQGAERHYLTFLLPADVDQYGLPPEAIIGRLIEETPVNQQPFTKENFVVNYAFVDFLQDVVRRRGPEDSQLIAAAEWMEEGMGLMLDHRGIDEEDRVLEDMIGAFEIKDGRIIPESYQKNDAYEVFSKDGFMTLDPWLSGVLLDEIRLKMQNPG